LTFNLIVVGLGVLIALSFGISDFLSKDVAGKVGAYKVSIYILVLSGIGTMLPALGVSSSFDLSTTSVLLLAFIAASTFLSFAALYRAYSKGMLSLTAPIANCYPAISVVLSVLLIGASFSLGALMSIATVILGIVMVSTSLRDLRTRLFGRAGALAPGVGSAMLAAVFFGASWTAYGYAEQTLGYLLPAIAVRFGAASLGLGAAAAIREDVRPVFQGTFRRLVAMSLLETVGVVLFSLASIISATPDAIPILTTFGGMSAAFTVCFAILFLKERPEINHVIGVILLIGGVTVLLYLTG